jgi:hypothetical protein
VHRHTVDWRFALLPSIKPSLTAVSLPPWPPGTRQVAPTMVHPEPGKDWTTEMHGVYAKYAAGKV